LRGAVSPDRRRWPIHLVGVATHPLEDLTPAGAPFPPTHQSPSPAAVMLFRAPPAQHLREGNRRHVAGGGYPGPWSMRGGLEARWHPSALQCTMRTAGRSRGTRRSHTVLESSPWGSSMVGGPSLLTASSVARFGSRAGGSFLRRILVGIVSHSSRRSEILGDGCLV
jgi:hypothetical protein